MRRHMEYEPLMTLGTAKRLGRVGWDALGRLLLVEFVAGPPGIDRPMPVALTPEAAEQLLRALRTCLADKGNAAESVQ